MCRTACATLETRLRSLGYDLISCDCDLKSGTSFVTIRCQQSQSIRRMSRGQVSQYLSFLEGSQRCLSAVIGERADLPLVDSTG